MRLSWFTTARAIAALAILVAASLRPAFALDAADLALLDTATWGVNVSSAAQFQALGRERWLQRQLHPGPENRLPQAAQAQIDAMPAVGRPLMTIVSEIDQLAKAANAIADPDEKKAAQQAHQGAMNEVLRQAVSRTILRALYAPDQLRERMTWFWFNRFNVHQGKANLRVTVGDYVDRAIRPHALGRFRDLLGATLRHPAMLRYLDNAENAAGRLNENYAREIMELHTMGVGSGYSQADVENLARILTGFGIDPRPEDPKLKPEWQAQLVRDGLFTFNPARHDWGDKTLLGQTIKGDGYAEVETALDLIARHPATAAHVSRAMAVYFVGDDPPEALVQAMAKTFQRTDGDIPAVLDTLFHAPEFKPAATRRFKDPMAFVLSAVRLAYDDKVVLNTGPIQGWLYRLGEGLFNRVTPDGYPLNASAWSGSGQMVTRFELARQIGGGSAGLFKPQGADAMDKPAFPLLQNALYFNGLRDTLGEATRTALDQAVSPQDWNTLFLSSPEFMR